MPWTGEGAGAPDGLGPSGGSAGGHITSITSSNRKLQGFSNSWNLCINLHLSEGEDDRAQGNYPGIQEEDHKFQTEDTNPGGSLQEHISCRIQVADFGEHSSEPSL